MFRRLRSPNARRLWRSPLALVIVALFATAAMVRPAEAGAGWQYKSQVAFSQFARIDRAASLACQRKRLSTDSASIVHFTDLSIRVAVRQQVRSRIPLTSPVYFFRYEGTSACKVYVPAG